MHQVEHLTRNSVGVDASFLRITTDPSGEYRYLRVSLAHQQVLQLRESVFGQYIEDVVPVLDHWRQGGDEAARVVTEVLDIDTDRILRNNPLLRSR